MKPRVCMVLGVLVLMVMATMSSPANAAQASTMAAPSPAAFLCNLNASTPAKITTGQPEPIFKTFPPPCGICSDFVCQTHSVGAVCGGGAIPWHCYNVEGTCPQDGNLKCSCVKNIP
jgi:hypothetical protein